MGESAEQLRKMQILQMADLGTARREMISTSEFRNHARAQLADIESKRQLDRRDEAQLSKWANLHADIGDTRGMEELDDIECGQSHRANLHAMLHPNGSQPRTYANHPYPTPSVGRGGGVMGKRGRGGFVPPPPQGPVNLPHPPARASTHGNFGRPGRPGPRGRSTTMPGNIKLDPALNCNNDDSDARDHRGSGRGRGKGKGRGSAQEQVHIPSAPRAHRTQRPPPAVNFAARISEPGEFMSLFQSRRATETYKSVDTIVSAPMEKTASSKQPIPPNEPKIKIPSSGTSKQKTATILPPSKSIFSQPHIGPYPVETPLPSPRVVPLDKTTPFKPRKPQPNAPSPSPSQSVSVRQSAKSKKAKDMAGSQVPYPAVVAITADEIQWKVSAGEEPRKKGVTPSKAAVSSDHSMPLNEAKKMPVTVANVAQINDGNQNLPTGNRKGKPKQKAQPRDLLSDDDSPVNAPNKIRHPLKTVAIQSPGTAELAGLKFAEKAEDSGPVKTIDEVIAPKTTNNEIPETKTRRNDQSQEPDAFSIYGPQIIEELRDIRRHIHSPQDLATTRDIERILEAKLLQLIPTASAAPAAPATSEIENRLGNLAALVERLTASQQKTNAVEVSSAAKRDLTPFEGHRSPAPLSSSSSSPPSADKRTHKVCVPGLWPNRSESPDIISRFETLQVSEQLAAPLQPQRAVPAPTLRPLEVTKRAITSDAPVQATPALESRPKQPAKRTLTLDDSMFAGPPIANLTSKARIIEPNVVRPQATTRALSANNPNIPKHQDVQSAGVRTIGPAPYKPRVIGPAPSVYEPTMLRDVSEARRRTASTQHANLDTRTENRSSLDVENRASSSVQPGRVFSMPDPATIPQPKVKAGSFPSNGSRRQ
ncbi:unnamed protein product [Penicillium glandicola]